MSIYRPELSTIMVGTPEDLRYDALSIGDNTPVILNLTPLAARRLQNVDVGAEPLWPLMQNMQIYGMEIRSITLDTNIQRYMQNIKKHFSRAIRYASVGNLSLPYDAFKILCQYLCTCPDLEELSLDCGVLRDDDAKKVAVLADVLAKLANSLKRLNICDNELSYQKLEDLIQALSSLGSSSFALERLVIASSMRNYNPPADAAAACDHDMALKNVDLWVEALIKLLEKFTNLKELNISSNHLTVAHLETLGRQLEQLEALDLGCNNLGAHDGGLALVDFLNAREWLNLKKLHLNGNGINQAAREGLIGFVRRNSDVTVYLYGNPDAGLPEELNHANVVIGIASSPGFFGDTGGAATAPVDVGANKI